MVNGADEEVQEEMEAGDDTLDHQTSRSGRIRALCFRRLSELFGQSESVL